MRWYTSDHHFGHRNIIGFASRPWDDVDSMGDGMLARHNAVVAPDDDVFIVGDLVWQPRWLHTVARMHGNKFLVPGNHDRCHKMHGSWAKHVKEYENAGLTITDPIITHEINGQRVKICHFPYYDIESAAWDNERGRGDRFSGLRPDDEGDFLIHGHVHTLWQTRPRMVNVGVDVWKWAPVSETTIIEIMERGT